MGLGEDLARFATRTLTRVEALQTIAHEELAERLAERLPEETPIYTGRLRDSYDFRIEDDRVIISSDEPYAPFAQFQTTEDENVFALIDRLALEIVGSADFQRSVLARLEGFR